MKTQPSLLNFTHWQATPIVLVVLFEVWRDLCFVVGSGCIVCLFSLLSVHLLISSDVSFRVLCKLRYNISLVRTLPPALALPDRTCDKRYTNVNCSLAEICCESISDGIDSAADSFASLQGTSCEHHTRQRLSSTHSVGSLTRTMVSLSDWCCKASACANFCKKVLESVIYGSLNRILLSTAVLFSLCVFSALVVHASDNLFMLFHSIKNVWLCKLCHNCF